MNFRMLCWAALLLGMAFGLMYHAHACEKPYHKPTWCELHRCV